jgi:hypothetical protein
MPEASVEQYCLFQTDRASQYQLRRSLSDSDLMKMSQSVFAHPFFTKLIVSFMENTGLRDILFPVPEHPDG